MAKAELPSIPQREIPQYGRIVGGLLDGWSYGLVDTEVAGRTVHLVVNATPPRWPFPTTVRMNPRTDFQRFAPGPGVQINSSARLIQHAVDRETYKWDK